MKNKDGSFNLDDTFFELFDELIIKLQETREIAQTFREKKKQKSEG